jgi:hypothetical protein
LLLSKRIEWKPCSYRPLNQGSEHDINESDIEMVAELNIYDRKLYDYVQEKIAAEIRDYGELFQDAFEEWMSARRSMEAGDRSEPVIEIGADKLPRVHRYFST